MRGSILALCVVAVCLAGVLLAALFSRGLSSSRTAAWAQHHLVLRLLAESGVEELLLTLRARAVLPDDPLGAALREGAPTAGAFVSLRPTALEHELPLLARSGPGPIHMLPPRGGAFVTLEKVSPTTGDPQEREAVIAICVGLTMHVGATEIVERVEVRHALKVSRVTLRSFPDAATPARLLVLASDPVTQPNFCPLGQTSGPPTMALSTASDASHLLPLTALMTSGGASGFRRLSPEAASAADAALPRFAPAEMARRAFVVSRTPTELGRQLARRLTGPGARLDGVFHCESAQPLMVSLSDPPVRGRCTISASGPIVVSGVRLHDPARDSVTLVSGDRILVTGGPVESALIAAQPEGGVSFSEEARVTGPVISARFPGWVGPKPERVGACEFGAGSAGSLDAGTVVSISPTPLTVCHSRER